MAKSSFFIIFSFALLFGQTPTLKNLKDYPRSLAKDFYIWHHLQKNISSKQADTLLSQANRVNGKLYKAYVKKSGNKLLKKTLRCFKLNSKQLLKEKDSQCMTLGLSPYKAALLRPLQRRKLWKKLKTTSADTVRWLKSMNSRQSIESTFDKNPEDLLMLFRRSGISFRMTHYNKKLSQAFIKKLSRLPSFDYFVETVAIDDRLITLRKSLSSFVVDEKVTTHARFYLGLIKVKQKKELLALEDFKHVALNDFFQMNRDKALFWSYLLTKEAHYLDTLYRSTDLNIYTIYAAEALNKPYIGSYEPLFSNKQKTAYDETNPFTWTNLLEKDKKMTPVQACEELERYNNTKTQALYAFYLEKCGKYAIHPFVTPYLKILGKTKGSTKALFYAIGRQESRLIAGGISSVFAMGMMQIMPFLSKAIAKQKRERLFLPDMFKPKKNIRFAKYHLKNLKRRLKHPLFIAYAYNGGRGYLRRQFKKGLFSKSRSPYEPFLSMESLSYPETREYGKKVLANYIVYSDLFKNPTSLTRLLRTLIK